MTVTRSSLALSAVAVLAALIGQTLASTGLAANSLGPVSLGRVSLVLMGGIAPGALAASVALLLPRHRATIIVLVVLGYLATAVAFVSFSVGFDEADEEVLPSPLGAALMPALLTAYVALTAAAAVSFWTVIPLRPRLRAAFAVGIGLLSAPFLIAAGFGYSALVLAVGTMLTLVIISAKGSDAARRVITDVAAARRRAVRVAAVVSLAITVLALGGGIGAGIVLTGTPGSTRAMGLMLAVGNLAAIPLLVALTLLLAARSRVARVGALVSTLGIAGCCGYLILRQEPADPFAFAVIVLIAASVGLWAGTVTWSRVAFTRGSRLLVVALVGLAVAVVYFAAVISSAGAVLALASGYLVFRGIRKQHPEPAMG